MITRWLAGIWVFVACVLGSVGVHAQAGPGAAYMYCESVAGPPAQFTPCSASNPLAVNATVSASITGFAPASTGTPITATTGGATGTLPAGTVVIVTNVGSANGAFCKLGASATTSDQYIAPGGGWFGFTVGAATQITCVTSTSTTTVDLVGGSGLPTGAGGALAATGSNAAASATGSGVPADASYNGVNISGTLRGQTGVNPTGSVYAAQGDVTSVNGVTVLTGAGATGTGSQRVTVAQDVTTIAGAAPGTAGSASANVVSVQGIASGTALGISAASLPLPTGAATSANQATEIASLSTIATNTGAAIPAGTAAIGTLLPFTETAASSGVLKASAGNLYTLSADAVTATTDLKLLLFNSATLPAPGTVTPYKCISFKGDGTQASLLLSWAPDALAFTTGLSAAVSSATACTTYTAVTATISGQVQ